MAQTVGNYEERDKRIELIGEYVLSTGDSTRNTADYFSKNFFRISNNTVSEYCKEYLRRHPDRKGLMDKVIENNKAQTIDNESVSNRVFNNANLVINNGMTIEEVSKATGISYWTVYRDLTDRLEKLDKELYDEVKRRFGDNSMGNIQR